MVHAGTHTPVPYPCLIRALRRALFRALSRALIRALCRALYVHYSARYPVH